MKQPICRGENKPGRRKSGWNRYVAFSVESANTPGEFPSLIYPFTTNMCHTNPLPTVPPPGCSIGWDERNVHLGEAWTLLSEDEKDVFSPVIFQYFSKIPCQLDGDDDEDAEIELSPEEIELYQPLYAKLVNQEKVALIISEGAHIGIKNSKAFEQAQRSVEKLNGEVSQSLFALILQYNANPFQTHSSSPCRPYTTQHTTSSQRQGTVESIVFVRSGPTTLLG
jgi:hypothetical protein